MGKKWIPPTDAIESTTTDIEFTPPSDAVEAETPLKKKEDTKPSSTESSQPLIFKSTLPSEQGTGANAVYGVSGKEELNKPELPDYSNPKIKQQQETLLANKKMFETLANKKLNIKRKETIEPVLDELKSKIGLKQNDLNRLNEAVNNAQSEEEKQRALQEKSTAENEHNELANLYNKSAEQYNIYNKAIVSDNKLDNALTKVNEGKQKAENVDVGEVFGKSLYNATLPALVKGIGSAVNVIGEVPEMISGQQMPEGMKGTDAIGNILTSWGDAIKADVPEAAQGDVWKDPTPENIAATAGNLLGNLALIIGTGGVGGATAAGATGMALGIDESYSTAKNAGLDDKHAAMIALPVGLINGALDLFGVGSILEKFEKKAVNKAIAKEAIDYLKDKEITQASAIEAVDYAQKEVTKKALKGGLETAGKETITGGAQAATQVAGEEVFDIATGEDKFKNTPQGALIKIGQNAIMEALGGGVAGTVFNANPSTSSIYDKAQQINKSEDGMKTFIQEVDAHVKSNEITPEQGEEVKNKLNTLIEVNNTIPKEITDKNSRVEAIDLISEKNNLESEVKQIDPAFVGDRKKTISNIEEMLGHIADGTQMDYSYSLDADTGKYYQIDSKDKKTEITKQAFDLAIKHSKTAVPEAVSKEGIKTTQNESNQEKVAETPKQRVKSLATELSSAEKIPKEVQEKIKESGLNGDVFSHKKAKSVADAIINSEGVEKAVELADKSLKGSVKAFVFGKAIDYYSQQIKEAKTQEEKDRLSELGANVAGLFEANSENYGRFISAIGEYYKNHPDIIKKRLLKKLTETNEKIISEKPATESAINSVLREFEKLKTEVQEKIENAVNASIEELNQNLSLEKKKRADKAISALEKFQSKIRANSYSDATGIVAAVDSAISVIIKAIKVGRSVSEAIQIGVNHINKKMNGEKWNEAKFRKDMEEGFKKEGVSIEKTQSKQEAILNKYFPKKRTESETKRKAIHEKIIDQYNAGVFEGGVNKDGQTFESLFYEKLGLVNPNSEEVQTKIGEFAEKMNKAPEGSIMWREVNQDMLNYLADIAKKTALQSGADKASAMWYANILSSPATHLRNLQYNVVQTLIAQPALMAQKAMKKGNFKEAATIYADLFKGLAKGGVEASRVLKTGRGTRFDVLSESGITDRGSKAMKFFALPGRLLRASDILFTNAAYNTKMGEIARNIVKSENPNLSNAEVRAKANELIGNTKERAQKAKEQAEKELKDFYGEDWQKVKGIKTIQKIREFELLENSMPAELQAKTEEAKNWSKRSLLTNKPTGIYGKVADIVQSMNDAIWFTRFVMPFINVPLNLAQGIIEKSPIGFIKAARGKEGFGNYATELTADQKQELFLKAANYTVAIAALAAINGDKDDDDIVITGQQTGNYTDNKGIVRGGGLEPYSLYIKGHKILSYKSTPLVAALMPVGYIRDYKLYGKNESASDEVVNVATNYLFFATETSAMMGMAGMFESIGEMKKVDAETVGKSVAKLASGFIPYSGAIKYSTNTINAIGAESDRRPIDWYENIYRDIPFAQTAIRTRKDHFGVPVRENLDIPLLPLGDRSFFSELAEKSPYYKLTSSHNYYPKFADDKTIHINKQAVPITPKELDDINVRRGEIVKEILDKKEDGVSGMELMNKLDNEDFKKEMNKEFSNATKIAKYELFLKKEGISKEQKNKAETELEKIRENPNSLFERVAEMDNKEQ